MLRNDNMSVRKRVLKSLLLPFLYIKHISYTLGHTLYSSFIHCVMFKQANMKITGRVINLVLESVKLFSFTPRI